MRSFSCKRIAIVGVARAGKSTLAQRLSEKPGILYIEWKSLFHWQFKTYWRWKRETPVLLSLPSHKRLKMFHFKHPREAEEWLASL